MEAVDIISNMTDKQLIALDRLYTTLLTGSKLVFMHTHWKKGQKMVQSVIEKRMLRGGVNSPIINTLNLAL